MAVKVRVAEVLARLGEVVEFAGRAFVAQMVPAVVCEPQVAACRVPVKTDAVAHAARYDLPVLCMVDVKAQDAREGLVGLADIAGRAHGQVEHPVGTELEILPAVVALRGQGVGHHHGLGRRAQLRVDVGVAQHAGHGAHEQIALVPGQARGHGEAVRDLNHLVRPPIPIAIDNGMHLARAAAAHIQHAVFAKGHLPRIVDFGVNRYRETRRQLEAIQGKLAGKAARAKGGAQQSEHSRV